MEKDLIKYAELIILKGINLQKNQCVLIQGSIENYNFLKILAKKAYEHGAKYVKLNIKDIDILKSRLKFSQEKSLEFVPNFEKSFLEEMVQDKWARINVDDTENFEDLKENIGQKMSIYQKALNLASKTLSQAIMSNEIAWCVVCSPGPKWASKVLNKKEGNETLEEFFKIQREILLLDRENPIKEWEFHGERLHKRCKILNELNLEKVIFKTKNKPGSISA